MELNIHNTYDPSDRPRYLTDDEIQTIIDVLPPTYSANAEEGELIRQALQQDIRHIVTHKKLCPSAIMPLANNMVMHHNTSRIAAGTAVGSHASEGQCHGPTQASLNSFHAIGVSKSSSSGIAGIEYLLYCKQHRENEICSVFYADKTLTYEEVLNTKKDIVGCVFSDFVKDYLYINTGRDYVKNYIIDRYGGMSKRWWHYNTYYINNVIGVTVPPDDAYVLRIQLDLVQMYRYRVTIQQLVDALKREHDTPIQVLYGPMRDGIIDIYACADYKEKKDGTQVLETKSCDEGQKDMISTAYYETILIPLLSSLRIKGVSGISDLTPIVTPIVSVIQDDTQIAWILRYQNNMNPNVIKLLQFFSIIVKTLAQPPTGGFVKPTEGVLLLTMPNYDDIDPLLSINKNVYLTLSPLDYIQRVVALDKQQHPDVTQTNLIGTLEQLSTFAVDAIHIVTMNHKKMKLTGIDATLMQRLLTKTNIDVVDIREDGWWVKLPPTVPLTTSPRAYINQLLKTDETLTRYTEMVYAEVSGTNLRGLMALPFVDHTRMMSNNIHIVTQVLGARAAKAYYVQDLYQVMSGFGLAPAHVLLVADVFFSKGFPVGAQQNSTNKQLGPIDKATVSKAVDVFKGTALQGSSFDISGMSTHIAFGLAPKVGSGYMDIAYNTNDQPVMNQNVLNAFKKEQAYIDKFGVKPIVTDNVNDDLRDAVENKEPVKSTATIKPLAPKGRKVNVQAETTVPVSKYAKPVEPTPTVPTVPVSKYAKPVESTFVPTSTIPTVPVSKYAKPAEPTPVNPDISVKSKTARKAPLRKRG